MRKTSLFLLFSHLALSISAQFGFNVELQAYPTGLIPGIRFEQNFKNNSSAHLRIGLNAFNHRMLGVQDEEIGSGFGFTLGYAKQIKQSKFAIGIRNDIWFNRVDWADFSTVPEERGQTDILVVQPNAELTYRIDGNKYSIRPSAAFGLEWNVQTEGRPTGQGPIFLIGIIVGKNKF